MTLDIEAHLVRDTLLGDAKAIRALVEYLTPGIQKTVAFRLLRSRRAQRDVRQEVADFTQEVLMALFEDRGKLLSDWEPSRGLKLQPFVRLLAERHVISALRSGRRNPWRADLVEPARLAEQAQASDTEEPLVARDELQVLWDRLLLELSPLGLRMFQLLFLEPQPTAAIQQEMALSADAVHAWRSRLRATARRLAGDRGNDKTPKAERRAGPTGHSAGAFV